jgi:uncharacterized membrane protein YdbT with pleckstrin-like domain
MVESKSEIAQQVEPEIDARLIHEYSKTVSDDVLSAYALNPTAAAFISQAKNEKIVLLLREHPIVLFKPVLLILISLILPIIFFSSPFLGFLPIQFHIAFMLSWIVVTIGLGLQVFIGWFFNVYLLTDERIIDMDFISIVSNNISSAKIDNIEDVTFNTQGAFAAFFDYGTVTIQTAAEKSQFEFDNVPHPSKVASLINELILEEEQEKLDGRANESTFRSARLL